MSQKDIFLRDEGNRWFGRNKLAYANEAEITDPVIESLQFCGIAPKRVFEVGCASGWRLAKLQTCFSCESIGIDPSLEAITAGKKSFPSLQLLQGTADCLPDLAPVDLLIFGFCLYLCDRKDLFRIAMEADRLIADGGYLVIYDFHPPHGHYRNPYAHKENVFSYKMDYSQLFTWHPAYCLIHRQLSCHAKGKSADFEPDEMVSVQVIKKDRRLEDTKSPF